MITGKYDYYKCGQCGQIRPVPKLDVPNAKESFGKLYACTECCSKNLQKARSVPWVWVQPYSGEGCFPKGEFMCYGFTVDFRTRSGELFKTDTILEIVNNGVVKFFEGEIQLLETPLCKVPPTYPIVPCGGWEGIYWLRPDHFPERIDPNKMHAVIKWKRKLVFEEYVFCVFVVEGDMIVEEKESE